MKGQAIIFESTPLIDRIKPVAVIQEVLNYDISGEVKITGEEFVSNGHNTFSIYIKDEKLAEVWCDLHAVSKDKVEVISIRNPVLKVKELSEKTKKQLETLIFDPVNTVMRDKDEIFAEIHKGRPSWRFFFEKSNYLHAAGKGILGKRLKGMKEESIEFINDVVRNEFQKAYTKKYGFKRVFCKT